MPAKDSGTSGSHPASQLERCSCTREQPMAAGPVAGLLNSSKKKKGCAKEEIKHPKRKTSSSGSKIKSTQKLVKERLQKEHVENAPAGEINSGLFFFLWFGRCRSKGRSCNWYKQIKRI